MRRRYTRGGQDCVDTSRFVRQREQIDLRIAVTTTLTKVCCRTFLQVDVTDVILILLAETYRQLSPELKLKVTVL
jgi:hypothetical protein